MSFNPFASRVNSARMLELEAVSAALNRAQAVIEFNLDGTVITANDNFLKTLGYTLEEIRGKPHSMFVTAADRGSEDYRRFWDRLRAGQYEAARYKRVGKGGREVWIQGSYNPLLGADGRPYKIVKFATDITAQIEASVALDTAVAETQQVVQAVLDGASDRRIAIAGKSGQLGTLAKSVNSLIEGVLSISAEVQNAVQGAIDGNLKLRVAVEDKAGHFKALSAAVNDLIANMMEVVKGLQKTSREVQTGAEEISRGNIDLSRRTEQQASSLEETASSMEQMTASVKNNADNAAQAKILRDGVTTAVALTHKEAAHVQDQIQSAQAHEEELRRAAEFNVHSTGSTDDSTGDELKQADQIAKAASGEEQDADAHVKF